MKTKAAFRIEEDRPASVVTALTIDGTPLPIPAGGLVVHAEDVIEVEWDNHGGPTHVTLTTAARAAEDAADVRLYFVPLPPGRKPRARVSGASRGTKSRRRARGA